MSIRLMVRTQGTSLVGVGVSESCLEKLSLLRCALHGVGGESLRNHDHDHGDVMFRIQPW